MSVINRNNYEIYFLDYLEGNLNPELKKEMELFLITNPDLKEELDGLEDATLSCENIIFETKQSLKNLSVVKRPERFMTDDDFLIAKIEGDLTAQEENDFYLYLQVNPAIEKEYSLLILAKLEVDNSLIFEDKSLLYKKEGKNAHVLTVRPHRFINDDDFLIAKIEGDLTAEEELVFDSYIRENPVTAKEYSLYKLSILKPDLSLVFEHKSTLKRLEITPRYYLLRKYSIAVASVAAVLLFITFFFFENEESALISYNTNNLSIIHRSSENKPGLMSENKLTFSGAPESNSEENKPIEMEIKVKAKLHAYAKLDNTINQTEQKDLSLNNPDISEIIKADIVEKINPDQQHISIAHDQPDNNKVEEISKESINTVIDKQNQSRPAPKTKKNVKSSDKDNFTIWDLAVLGVRGLSNLSGSKIELKKQYDADGNVKSLAFNSPRIEFSAPVKKR